MIDIIIPVYDGFKETKECVESLMKFNNETKCRFIIINDKSPNEKIVSFLNSIKNENFIILENIENLGFVRTVNKGMQYSDTNDVILLNSDTIVTKKWVDKMYTAAYINEKIGTVTSFTNNGTIASVPYFNRDNELPSGYTIDDFADLIDRTSERLYPTIPTAVGHAMYIKRKVLTEVGYFDDEAFGMGYGEEEDFSCRVIKKGYKNIIADDTYIYHYGSTSFKSEKANLIRKNKRKLHKKHWWHPLNVKKFLYFDNDVKKICKSIQLQLKSK